MGERVVKISEEAYGNLKKMSEETGLPISSLVSDLVTSSGKGVTTTKTVTLKPSELCYSCREKVRDELLKDTKVTVDGSGSDSALGWILVGLLALAWLGQRQQQEGNQDWKRSYQSYRGS